MLTRSSLVERLISSGIAKAPQIIGCTPSEITLVQETVQHPLPKAYTEFLSSVGKSAGGFLKDLEVYFPKMIGMNARAIELLDDWEHGKLRLPDRAFVFSMRYGEQFLFFIADGKSDNPPIYLYSEGKEKFIQVANSFWDAIESELRMSEDFRREYPDSPFNK